MWYHAVIYLLFSRDLSDDRPGMFLRYSFAECMSLWYNRGRSGLYYSFSLERVLTMFIFWSAGFVWVSVWLATYTSMFLGACV